MPASSPAPARPARLPDPKAVTATTRAVRIPPNSAARGLAPAARIAYPHGVRLRTSQTSSAHPKASGMPRWNRYRSRRIGSCAASAISGDCGHWLTGSRHGPSTSAETR